VTGVRKPHPDLAEAIRLREKVYRTEFTAMEREHIDHYRFLAAAVAEWLTSLDTCTRVTLSEWDGVPLLTRHEVQCYMRAAVWEPPVEEGG